MTLLRPIVKKELKYAAGKFTSAIRRQLRSYFSKVPRSILLEQDRLHLGCGPRIMPGWLNADIYPQNGAYFLDAAERLPFPSDSLSTIHCEHFLEHLEFEDALSCLTELHRTLKPGGLLRLIVPDLNVYCQAYVLKNQAFFDELRYLGGSSQPLDTHAKVLNQMFRMGGAHHFAWDEDTLTLELRKIGFNKVARSSSADNTTGIDAQDDWRTTESLYLNITK